MTKRNIQVRENEGEHKCTCQEPKAENIGTKECKCCCHAEQDDDCDDELQFELTDELVDEIDKMTNYNPKDMEDMCAEIASNYNYFNNREALSIYLHNMYQSARSQGFINPAMTYRDWYYTLMNQMFHNQPHLENNHSDNQRANAIKTVTEASDDKLDQLVKDDTVKVDDEKYFETYRTLGEAIRQNRQGDDDYKRTRAKKVLDTITKAILDEQLERAEFTKRYHKNFDDMMDNSLDDVDNLINNTKVMSFNEGNSNYSKHKFQPWDIWEEYNLNPWDADIVKRVLREKPEPGMTETESRILDYKKIIHVALKRIDQLSQEK